MANEAGVLNKDEFDALMKEQEERKARFEHFKHLAGGAMVRPPQAKPRSPPPAEYGIMFQEWVNTGTNNDGDPDAEFLAFVRNSEHPAAAGALLYLSKK